MIEYIRKNKDIQVLAYSGNPGMDYPDDYPLICSSMTDHHLHKGKKLLIFHEIIPEFSYKPVTEEAKYIVRSHTNSSHVLFYSQRLDFERAINEQGYKLFIHGGGGRDGVYLSTKHAISLFHDSLAALHLHPTDGYGLGLAHIAATGRIILTDFSFYMGKTLWPIVQAWGIDVGSDNGYKIARKFLDAVPLLTPERMERQANWVKDFFNYEGDAERVRKFLDTL